MVQVDWGSRAARKPDAPASGRRSGKGTPQAVTTFRHDREDFSNHTE